MVFKKATDGYVVTAEALGILRIVSVDREGIAVIAIEPIFRAKPHEAFVVFQDGLNRAFREALILTQVLKTKRGRLRVGRHRQPQD